jgi:serine phosphatase RsbU (regulator of sigma subunit)
MLHKKNFNILLSIVIFTLFLFLIFMIALNINHAIKETQNNSLHFHQLEKLNKDLNKLQHCVWTQAIVLNFIFIIIFTIVIYLQLKINKENRNLKKLHSNIEKLNNELERRVTERTLKFEKLNRELTDSIQYASLIQRAIISEEDLFNQYFKDYFVLWQPRDIVGGDIYFIEEIAENELIIMVIDSTGHGVSGAFITMLVKAIEKQIITSIQKQGQEISSSQILSFFNKSIKHLLKQHHKNKNKLKSNVGFDGAVIYLNLNKKVLKYSGASTPLLYIQDNKLNIIKGDRKSIGYRDSDENFKFTEFTIDIKKETSIYITTDGYIDQIGGIKGFPLGKSGFKKILNQIYKFPFITQKTLLIKKFNNYRKKEGQIDDITLLGFKI